MSTCPENDLHSLYLDGELPEEFIAEYEAHVASCPKCSAMLEKLTELKGFIHEDSSSISFTQKQLDESFARLQAKMSYSTFKKEEKRRSNVVGFPKFRGFQYFAAGVAAAAVVAFALPGGKSSEVAVQTEFSPLTRSVSRSGVNPVMLESNIDAVHYASFLGSEETGPSVVAVPASEKAVAVQKMIFDDCGAYVSPIVKPALADYDVFTPVDSSGQKEHEAEHSKGFTFSVSSPFLKVSFQVGK